MAKQRKKKKRSTLSAQEQDFVRLLGMSNNPKVLARDVVELKLSSKNFLSTLEMETPFSPPAETAKAKLFLEKLFKEDADTTYAYTMRSVIQGYWMSHRIVFEITPEIIDFVNSDYWLFKSKMNIARFMQSACGEPILLDFSRLGMNESLICGMTSVLEPGEDPEKTGFPFYINQIFIRFNGEIKVWTASLPAASTDVFLTAIVSADNNRVNINGLPIMRLLTYIGYLLDLEDEDGRFLIQDKPNSPHYRMLPMAARDDDPIPGSTPEWANSGLRIAYGYLDRQVMLQAIAKQRDATEVDPTAEIAEFTEEAVDAIFSQALLDWESSRMIYLFDDKSGAALVEKYGDGLDADNFLADLERYMPTKTFAISYKGLTSFFVTTCKVKGEAGPRVFIHNLFEPDGMYLCGKGDVTDAPAKIDSHKMREVLCAVKHILTILQQREERKLSAVPVTAKASGAVFPPKKKDDPPKPAMYEGGSIALSDPAPRIFEVTGRTVKKLSNKELVQRHGWTMTPHTRRSHAHRYWVGKGENRHLEVRWLQDMKINVCMEDGGAVSTVVRKIE